MVAAHPPADAADPRLATARDPDRMRAIFREHLRLGGGTAVDVADCRVTFVRDQRAGRALFQYALRLADPATGREWDQQVSGVAYGGDRTRRTWERLRRSGAAAAGAATLAPFAFVPELDLLLQVFPHDHRLPALARLLAGPPPELDAVAAARSGPGGWRIAGWTADAVRYRVDIRATVRVAAVLRDDAGRAVDWPFYAKVYRDEAEGARAHRLLGELGAAGGDDFAVGEPVAWLAGMRTLVQEDVRGVPLSDVLVRGEGAIAAARRTARALAALHLSDVDAPQRRSLRQELVQLEEAGALLRAARPDLGARIGAVVNAVVAGLPEVEPRTTHGDLKPGHVLLDGDRVALLDFDKLSAADPLRDVGDLLALLTRFGQRGRFPDGRLAAIGEAFVEDYFGRVPVAWRARFPLRLAMAVLGAAATTGRGVRERVGRERSREQAWTEHVPALVAAAEGALAGRPSG